MAIPVDELDDLVSPFRIAARTIFLEETVLLARNLSNFF
jgi:hypothetical protein